jgi:hypothetical protein
MGLFLEPAPYFLSQMWQRSGGVLRPVFFQPDQGDQGPQARAMHRMPFHLAAEQKKKKHVEGYPALFIKYI